MRRVEALLFAALAAWPVAATASPCVDDHWQPTFVHDLDNEDGPYYVGAGGGFLKMRWSADGGYVPHACELVKGPQDVRDVVGFTNCREYTRIQCGCSRANLDNRTCAAFLSWHPRTPAGVVGAGPTSTPVSVPISPANWPPAPQHRGAVTSGPAGLTLHGGRWSNGRLRDGFLDGNHVYSREVYDFTPGGDAYLRFAVDGGGKYMVVWPRVVEGVSVRALSTDHSWAGSVVVAPNVWLFAHLKVYPDGGWRHVVSLGQYDDAGGRPIAESSGRFTYPRGRLELQFGDNYAGEGASVTIGEAKVAAAGSAVVVEPVPSPQPGRPPGGGTCSSNADCPGAICLLGVCASGAGTPRY